MIEGILAWQAIIFVSIALGGRKRGWIVGFWVVWHTYGGFEGLTERYGMHPSTVWRKVAKFRKTFGVHPDEYQMPGVTIEPASFWRAAVDDQQGTGS